MAFLFKRKKEKNDSVKIDSCISGEIIPIEKVDDSIFSTKILGDGYAVVPSDENVYAPLSFTVKDITAGGLSITGKTEDGLNVLISLGINLSKSKKKYVKLLVKTGDKAERGSKIAEINYKDAFADQYDPTVCVVVMNSDNLKSFCSCPSVSAAHGDKAAEYVI